ncbi:hypothetical protein HOG21_01620 [bacterium]|jgi:hypothetical protein|nr:hypothetical protein [bacterium]
MIQISATSFNSRCKSLSSTTSHNSAKAGACLIDEQKCEFQNPHFHHLATNNFTLCSDKSAIISIVLASFTIVHTGTFKIKSGAFAP